MSGNPESRERLLDQQVRWAHTYDGYERLAGSPADLERLLAPAREQWRRTGEVPDWSGVDLLRGWAFYLTRRDRFAGGTYLAEKGEDLAEWNAVLARLAAHPSARPEESPPLSRALPMPIVAPATEPRMHRVPGFLEAKQARWFEPHIAPMNALVQEIARDVGGDVPFVDPDCGGVNARVLLLLEAPAGAAAHGSRMLSADNDDGTAANVWRAYETSGLPRAWGMHWNAVPWYIGVPGKIRAASAQDIRDGRVWLARLLDLMPDLRVVLTLGKSAAAAVAAEQSLLGGRSLQQIEAPHPSQRVYNVTRGTARLRVHAAFTRAFALADSQPLLGEAAVRPE